MLGVIQARMGSTRLPGKVLRPLGDRPVLGWVIEAVRDADVTSRVVVATSTQSEDDPVVDFASAAGADVVRGDSTDVLGRFLLALDRFGDQPVIRLTADCPLLDPGVISMAGSAFIPTEVDYLSTVNPRSLPRGLDVEVASAEALRTVHSTASDVERVHVTAALYSVPGRFRTAGLCFHPDASDLRVTLDTHEDAALLDAVVAALGHRARERRVLVDWLRAHPEVVALNADVRQKRIDEG